MTGRRRAVDPGPVAITKRLVAHVHEQPESFGVAYGPRDGEPVAVPAPCARLVAGYWCACGSGFTAETTQEQTFRARVVAAPDGAWRGYVDDDYDGEYWIERPVHRPGGADRRALQQAVENLELGTVVERFGAGVAPAFDRFATARLDSARWVPVDEAL